MLGTSLIEKTRLNARQNALKLLANSTSYSILAEFIVDRRTGDYKTVKAEDDSKSRNKKRGFSVDVYTGSEEGVRLVANRLETPGEYFAGPIATHITAGGRLLLAIIEKLAADRGITHVFCDTDSMCFARPEGMERDEFRRRAAEIVDWFEPLYPYGRSSGEKLSILQYEEVNFRDGKKANGYEPLYAVAISAKRYAFFNRVPFASVMGRAPGKGEPEFYPLFRKISAHGTGQISEPADYTPSMPKPDSEKGLAAAARWATTAVSGGVRRTMPRSRVTGKSARLQVVDAIQGRSAASRSARISSIMVLQA